MLDLKRKTIQAIEFFKSVDSNMFDIGMVLGTGLGSLADATEQKKIIPYSEIPNFPLSTIKFHEGNLVMGYWAGKSVIVMQGRFHYYEGYSMQAITLPIRVMAGMGVKTLIVTNAAAGIKKLLEPGTTGLIRDHINLMGDNPLIGKHDPFLGTRFPDMSDAYCKKLRTIAKENAKKMNLCLPDVVYAGISGPSCSTPAEIKMMQKIGADVVGMSTVPEVLTARQLGLDVLGLSLITDQALPDKMEPVSPGRVKAVAEKTTRKLLELLQRIMKTI